MIVKPSRLGPIVFAAKNIARATRTDSDPWIEHDLVFRNTGDRPITLADTRSSKFIGEAGHWRLLAADQGCGYALDSPRARAEAGACNGNVDLVTVRPRASAKRSITLFRGLRGMDRLIAGTYVFRRPVRLRTGRGQAWRAGVLRLAYVVEARSE